MGARFVRAESVEVTLLTEGEIQSQLSFCHCSSQSRGNVTESGTLCPTVLGSNLAPSMLSGTNLTCVEAKQQVADNASVSVRVS